MGSASGSTRYFASTMFSDLSPGNHTVDIVKAQVGSFTSMMGVAGINETGVCIHNFSTPGISWSNYNTASTTNALANFTLSECNGGAANAITMCDVLIISLGANDGANDPTDTVTYATDYLTANRLSWPNTSDVTPVSILVTATPVGAASSDGGSSYNTSTTTALRTQLPVIDQ